MRPPFVNRWSPISRSSHADESESKYSHANDGCPSCRYPPYFQTRGSVQNILIAYPEATTGPGRMREISTGNTCVIEGAELAALTSLLR